MRKKLAILGTGSSGVLALAHFLYYLDNSWDVVSISDPTIPILGIGESTNPGFVHSLELGTNFNMHDELLEGNIDATLKLGTYYEDWRSHSFINPFLGGSTALHMNTHLLKDWAIPKFKQKWKNRFQELFGNVTNLKNFSNYVSLEVNGIEHTFDYVMDCRGFSKETENYIYVNNPSNHCLVHNKPVNEEFLHTKHVATEDGWMFVVPLKSRESYGYLFNNNITDVDTAKRNFSIKINVPINELDNISYSFKSYYTTKLIEGRIIKNGNRAAFFEPMFANSLWLYDTANRTFYDYLIGSHTEESANNHFKMIAKGIEEMICFHYHGGSLYKTPFWDYAVEHSTEILKNSTKIKETQEANNYFKTIARNVSFTWGFDLHALQLIDKNMEYNYLL